MKRTNNVHRANSPLYKDFAYENTFEKIAVLFLRMVFPLRRSDDVFTSELLVTKKRKKEKKSNSNTDRWRPLRYLIVVLGVLYLKSTVDGK